MGVKPIPRTLFAATGIDAELIATCAAFCDLEWAYIAVGGADEANSLAEARAAAERARIVAEQDALVDRMRDLPCTTLRGVQAMAQGLAAWDQELLRDCPDRDVGKVITSLLVERILALPVPHPDPHPDADLLAACADFRASEAAFSAIYDDEGLMDETCEILAEPVAQSWSGMLDRMGEFHATTSDGLAARALALAQHSGIKPGTSSYPFAFHPGEGDGGVTGRLLHMLLVDAMRMCDAQAQFCRR